jgi:ribosome-associated protein
MLDDDALAFAVESGRLAIDRHCEDVRLLDVRGLSQVCDFVLVASGTSDRQAKSVAAELEDLGTERGFPPYRSNRDDATTWTVVDFVSMVAHLFEPSRRAYYDLEELWSDAPLIEFDGPRDSPL